MGLAFVNRQLIFKKTASYDLNQNPSKNASSISANLSVKNISLQDIIFKIRSTSVEKFKVYPSIGVLSAGVSQPSKVIWKSETPLQSLSSERFQVQVIPVPRNISITPSDPLSAGRCTCQNVARESSKDDWSKIKDLKTVWEKLARNTVESEKHNVLCFVSSDPEPDPSRASSSAQPAKAPKETTKAQKGNMRDQKEMIKAQKKPSLEETTTDEEHTEPEEEINYEQSLPDDFTEVMCVKTGGYLWKFVGVATTILFAVFTSHLLGFIPPKTEYIIKLPDIIKETFVGEPAVEEVPETWLTMFSSAKDGFLHFFRYQINKVLSLGY